MAITVLCVEQGHKSAAMVTPNLLKGRFKKAPYRFVHVSVPNANESDAGRIPVEIISEAVKNTRGRKILLGNSTGGSYLAKGVRDGAFDSYPDDELEFLLLANPERRYGGWCTVPSPSPLARWDISPFGGVGMPADVPWRVVDFARRYDICADAATADNPGFRYRLYAGSVGLALHMNYFTVSPEDLSVLRYQDCNVEYLLHGSYIHAGFEKFYKRPPFTR